MKKILLAFDGTHFSQGAIGYAKWINTLQPIQLTGAFLPLSDYASLWSYAEEPAGKGKFIPLMEQQAQTDVLHNIERFKSICAGNHISYTIHRDFTNFTLPELKKETRYADMLVIGAESFFAEAGPEPPNLFLNDALHQSECPVLLVPEKFRPPSENIIAYDGSASAVYAIKQFAGFFPSLCNNDTLLVYAGGNETENLPDEKNIKELCATYFPRLTTLAMDINPRKYFASWIKEHSNALLVTGAFGRSGFSQLFKKSFLSAVMSDHALPIFVAHR